MIYVSISVVPLVADELRKLSAETVLRTGKRRTFSDLIMRGIELAREETLPKQPCQS